MITALVSQHMKTTATLLLVQAMLVKICYMLKILEKIDNKKPFHIITRSSNQYVNYKTGTKIKPIDKTKDQLLISMIC